MKHKMLNFTEKYSKPLKTGKYSSIPYSCLKYLNANSIIENLPSSELEAESTELKLCKSSKIVDPMGFAQIRLSGLFD